MSPASSPNSHSVVISGRRFGSPAPPTEKPGSFCPSTFTVSGSKKNWASRNPGRSPERPNAARARSELRAFIRGNQSSSSTTQEALAAGYQIRSSWSPKELSSSARTARFRKYRSSMESRCSMAAPTVRRSLKTSFTEKLSLAAWRDRVPARSPLPKASLLWKSRRVNSPLRAVCPWIRSVRS
jgi:hypothetical protein